MNEFMYNDGSLTIVDSFNFMKVSLNIKFSDQIPDCKWYECYIQGIQLFS